MTTRPEGMPLTPGPTAPTRDLSPAPAGATNLEEYDSPSPMIPELWRVTRRRQELGDTATLTIEPVDEAARSSTPHPGQFAMLWWFGVGEVAISYSSIDASTGSVSHTVRAVGPVTTAIATARVGDILGARGPFGQGWDLDAAVGNDVVLVGGGLGLAPIRSAVEAIGARRGDFGSVALLAGARSPGDLLYLEELGELCTGADIDLHLTVDHLPSRTALVQWRARVGVVTDLIGGLVTTPARTTALVCGPEIMMRYAARALTTEGLTPGNIQISLERNMHCGIGLCGHCQLGPLLVCRDGPVVTYDVAGPWLTTREL